MDEKTCPFGGNCENCKLMIPGFGKCVFIAINANLGQLNQKLSQ